MKKLKYVLMSGLAATLLLSSCNDYLDVNTNPNYPYETQVPPHALLAPMIQQVASGIVFDARFVGRYTQNWVLNTGLDAYDSHGYVPGSDANGEIWRTHYWTLGKNVDVMIDTARRAGRNVYVGIAYALRAYSWQMLTDMHGDVILDEAFREQTSFKFDSQDKVYAHVLKMCDSAIYYLRQPTKADPNLATADQLYGGNAARWIRFAWGVRARNLSHLTAKSTYDANAVIAACDSSMTANTDNATVPYDGTITANANFFGTLRNNLGTARNSVFVTSLVNGLNPATLGARDPRMAAMFQIATGDSIARGAEPRLGTSATNIFNPWGTTTVNPASTGGRGRFIFHDNARFPLMTYFEIQMIKAEAALRKGDKVTALAAYRNAIGAHVDFINGYVGLAGSALQVAIPATGTPSKASLLADTRLVPAVADSLTMRRVMLQKYIVNYGWNHVETWTDLRRYRYGSVLYNGENVYPNFTIPTILFNDNGGRPVYRVRPRFNSEYVWNRTELDKIGALALDYHCKEMWFMQP